MAESLPDVPELTPDEWHAVQALWKYGNPCLEELRQRYTTDMEAALRSLQKKELVTSEPGCLFYGRSAEENDNRVERFSLTQAGNRLFADRRTILIPQGPHE